MSKQTWEALWKKQAKNTGAIQKFIWFLRHNTSKTYARLFAAHLRHLKSPRILEIGCGSALTFKYLRKNIPKAQLTGIDFSPTALKIARKSNPGCKFAEGDARRMPLASNTYDFVYSLGLIEHFSRADAQKIVNEHSRVAKRGGTVMIMVPAKYSLWNVARLMLGKRWPWGFEDPFSKTEFRKMLRRAHLRVIEIRRIRTVLLLGFAVKK